jgi:glycosyltransferase involved in cell wall biosynthesis
MAMSTNCSKRTQIKSSRIAVLIPVFNQLEGLLRTLESVDSETADLEFFVVDDGSTPAIDISQHRFVHPVNLITLTQNRGCAFARNAGLEQIVERGFEYVALQDAGDVDVGERMAKQTLFLDQNPDIAVVGAWGEYVDMDGNLLYVHKPPSRNREIRARMPFSSAFIHPACMIRASALQTIGFYNTSYPNTSDYELLYRLTRKFESANLPEVLIKKENNPASLSLGKRRRGLKLRLRVQLMQFRFLSLRSYLGVMTTLAFICIPYRFILAIKEWRGYAN